MACLVKNPSCTGFYKASFLLISPSRQFSLSSFLPYLLLATLNQNILTKLKNTLMGPSGIKNTSFLPCDGFTCSMCFMWVSCKVWVCLEMEVACYLWHLNTASNLKTCLWQRSQTWRLRAIICHKDYMSGLKVCSKNSSCLKFSFT